MAESNSTRLGLRVWGASSDGPSRAEFNTSFANLELLTAIDKQDTFANRPAAGVRGTYFWDTTNSYLWRDNGSGWSVVGQNTRDATIKSSAIGVVPLTVNAITGQTALLTDLQVNGSSQFSVSAGGNMLANGTLTGKSLSVTNATAATPVLYGKGAASQSANLLTLQDNSNANILTISPTGVITSPFFANAASGANTVLNGNSASNVANMTNWSGSPSVEFKMTKTGTFNDFLYLKHAVADASVANRRLGIVMKAGDEDASGAARSAAIYLLSTQASFNVPSLRIDVRDIQVWSMHPENTNGSTTTFPINITNNWVKSTNNSSGNFAADNTWIGTQNSGNTQYFRSGNDSSGFYWYAGGTHSNTEGAPGSGGVTFASLLAEDTTSRFTVGRITISDNSDAGVGVSTPPLQIGPTNGTNMVFDAEEIVVRNNGGTAAMRLQQDGGELRIGATDTEVYYQGRRVHVSSNGVAFPSPAVNDVWLDARAVSGGFKVYSGSGWVKP